MLTIPNRKGLSSLRERSAPQPTNAIPGRVLRRRYDRPGPDMHEFMQNVATLRAINSGRTQPQQPPMNDDTSSFPFMKLPKDVRKRIYDTVLKPEELTVTSCAKGMEEVGPVPEPVYIARAWSRDDRPVPNKTALLCVCRQINDEAKAILYHPSKLTLRPLSYPLELRKLVPAFPLSKLYGMRNLDTPEIKLALSGNCPTQTYRHSCGLAEQLQKDLAVRRIVLVVEVAPSQNQLASIRGPDRRSLRRFDVLECVLLFELWRVCVPNEPSVEQAEVRYTLHRTPVIVWKKVRSGKWRVEATDQWLFDCNGRSLCVLLLLLGYAGREKLMSCVTVVDEMAYKTLMQAAKKMFFDRRLPPATADK